MGRQDEIVKERVKKLVELRAKGLDPYVTKYNTDSNSAEIQKNYANIKSDEKTKDKYHIAGRLISVRDLGKICFLVLQDGYGKIQLILQEGETPDNVRELFKKFIDG